MTLIRATWPPRWDKTLEALCQFYGIRAHAASKSVVLLLTGQGEPFAQVPSDITVSQLKFAIPLLLDAFELGKLNGESRIKARMRDLLRADPQMLYTTSDQDQKSA